MPAALVCGVSGQDGAYLARLLLEKGYQVYGTSRDSQMSSFHNLVRLGIQEKITLLSMVPTDFRSVLQALKASQPDEIYHLAGQSSVGLSFEQPAETLESIGMGTLNLLEAIRFQDLPVRFYHAGSSECFGDTRNLPADEDTPFRPRSPYGVAKATAFWAVANYREAYGLFACSGILFNHESPLRPPRFVTQKIITTAHRIAQGSPEKLHLGNIQVQRDWGWAPEYVEAMYQMLQQPSPEDYVIATGTTTSLEDFVIETFNALNLNWQDHVSINQSLFRPTDISVGRANPTKAKEKLGWQAQSKMSDIVRMMLAALET
ncbi:MAG: GDP-mannose 4,6-dehydratase [Prochlorotrichaceae cyanobacterium]